MRQSIQEWATVSKFCGRQPLKYFKGCLPQNLLSPLFNTLSHLTGKVIFLHKIMERLFIENSFLTGIYLVSGNVKIYEFQKSG